MYKICSLYVVCTLRREFCLLRYKLLVRSFRFRESITTPEHVFIWVRDVCV